jgi:oligopeptide transport system ATP-binding protein
VRGLRVLFRVPRGPLRRPAVLRAVDGVDFDLEAGETLGVVGESGCGKSTLGRAVLRLIEPAAGTVAWRGRDLRSLGPRELRSRRREMQMVFQDPVTSLDPRMTVGAILAEPLETFQPGLSAAGRRRRVEEAMAEVGLAPEMVNRYPHEVSGGQAQRVAIARAVIAGPSLLVCDEPVSALDVSIRAQIVNLLKRLQRERGLSMIFIGHDLSVVRQVSHRIMVLHLGRVAEIADRDAIFRDPRHPYTRALISAVPIPDPDRERAKRRLVLAGEPASVLAPPSGCGLRTRCPLAHDRCAAQAPALEEVRPGHLVACHLREG